MIPHTYSAVSGFVPVNHYFLTEKWQNIQWMFRPSELCFHHIANNLYKQMLTHQLQNFYAMKETFVTIMTHHAVAGFGCMQKNHSGEQNNSFTEVQP